jgi:hypothetical protein
MNPEWISQNPVADPVLATYFLFHDCDLAALRWGLTTLRLFFPEAAYRQAPAALPAIPSTYIRPSDDRTLLPGWMRQVQRNALASALSG